MMIAMAGLAAGCRAPDPEGCYDLAWPSSPVTATLATPDSIHLTGEAARAGSRGAGELRYFRVTTAVESPDTVTVCSFHLCAPRSPRWYSVYRDATWRRVGRDSVRVVFSEGADSQVLRARVTRSGMEGTYTRYGVNYRQEGDSFRTVPGVFGHAGFTAVSIGCPARDPLPRTQVP
jgi:hypothetical protein